ncbi:hypothetical protein L6R46_11235 [Myxococcota bacterium]|jgi:hypothetical protein|nr:hypothetical protein [Myxococcota bacterium]
MTRSFTLLLLALGACTGDPYKDDSPTDDSAVTDDTNTTDDSEDPGLDSTLVGAWLSEGENLSPLFAGRFFKYVSVNADFKADSTYAVQAVDEAGATYDFTGTFTIDETTDPASIVLEQATPTVVTAEGIYDVDDADILTYEVVQTTPNPNGFVAPTPETGFGSSSGPGLNPGDNVQKYVRQ